MEASTNLIMAVVATVAWSSNDPMCGTASVRTRLYADSTTSKDVTPVRWPWNAAIHTSSRFRPEQYCGGALITRQHVLTAAHCIDQMDPDGIRIHLGSWRRSELDNGEIAVPVKEMCIHQNFTGDHDDIAIIKLAQPVNFTTTIRPVCLPERKEHLPTDSEAYATGWTIRKTKETHRTRKMLQELKMRLMNVHQCVKSFDVSLYEESLCAPHDYGSLCEGDSGAPAMQKIDGHWFLQGILSGGPPVCGDVTLPMVFTRVASYLDTFINPYLRANTYNRKMQVCTLL
ncbi:chymotrypsin-like protease CTRL-1 [Haemaphysalis longicornis]